MAQDIREMFRDKEAWTSDRIKKGHQKRFSAKLDRTFPKEKNKSSAGFFYLKIAAVLVVALAAGFYVFESGNLFNQDPVADTPVQQKEEMPAKEFQLSEVSPQFKKIEDYYLASLNMELAKLEVNEKNKSLVNSFMEQLAELDKEYGRLNKELKEAGPNEQTIEAMINNLQLRLEMLYRLKDKLQEINQKNQENYENLQA